MQKAPCATLLLMLLHLVCGEYDLEYSCNPSGLITVLNPDPVNITGSFAQTTDGAQNCTTLLIATFSVITISGCPISRDISLWFTDSPEFPEIITADNLFEVHVIRCQQIPSTGVYRKVTDESWVTNYLNTSLMPAVTPTIIMSTQIEDMETGIIRTTAIVGEPLLWEIEGPENYILLPQNCTVESGIGDEIKGLVLDGCSLDTYLLTHFEYASATERHILRADFFAFRFANSERIIILCDMLGCHNASTACDFTCPSNGNGDTRRSLNEEEIRRLTESSKRVGNMEGQVSVSLKVFNPEDLTIGGSGQTFSNAVLITATSFAVIAYCCIWRPF